MNKLVLTLILLCAAGSAVSAQEGRVEVGEETAVRIAEQIEPEPTSVQRDMRGMDQVQIAISPRTIMWNPQHGIAIQVTITIQNPSGRYRRVVVHWGDDEHSQFDFFYGAMKRVSDLPERLVGRQSHRYRSCAPRIPVFVELYAVRFEIAWEDAGSHVMKTDDPFVAAGKAVELQRANHPFHVSTEEWIRIDQREVPLIVGACG